MIMSAKKSSKKKTRVFLDSPWSMKWANITGDDETAILQEIEFILSKHPEMRKSGKNACSEKPSEGKTEDKGNEQWIHFRKQLEIGINSVTRGLEKDSLVAVLLGRSPDPPLLTKHIMPLCATRNVPVVSLREMDKVAKLMNISCLTALGLKHGAEEEASIFHNLWKCIKDKSMEFPCPIKLLQVDKNSGITSPANELKTKLLETEMKYVVPSGKPKLKKKSKK